MYPPWWYIESCVNKLNPKPNDAIPETEFRNAFNEHEKKRSLAETS